MTKKKQEATRQHEERMSFTLHMRVEMLRGKTTTNSNGFCVVVVGEAIGLSYLGKQGKDLIRFSSMMHAMYVQKKCMV